MEADAGPQASAKSLEIRESIRFASLAQPEAGTSQEEGIPGRGLSLKKGL